LIVFEVTKAVSAALDELHFAVEALCNSIVPGKALHAGDGLGPGAKGIGEGDEGLKAAGGELVDEA